MIVLINQLTIPIFLDIANAASSEFHGIELFTGKVDDTNVSIHPRLRIVKSLAYNRANFFTRIFTWIMFSLHLGLYLLFKKEIKQVWVVTNPPIAPFVVKWLSVIKEFTYSIIVFDLYPDALQTTGFVKSDSWLYRKWKDANRRLFGEAKHVVTLSDSMKKAIAPYLHHVRDIMVIPNWADTVFFSPRPRSINRFVKGQEIVDRFIVMYSGNLGLTHDLESIIESARILKESPAFVFIIVGDGGKRNLLIRLADSYKLQNVRFLPLQPYQLLPDVLAAADVAIVTLGSGAEGISVPSKTYYYMASGACLVCVAPDGSELSRIVRDYDCGVSVEPGNAQRLAGVLRELHSDSSRLDRYRGNSRAAAELYCGKHVDQYVQLMKL